ncbi:MAG: hypothetical protein PHQ05_05110 [Sterolibacterium sp.]|nr:hypothetical protein [Sterolibacterium sp.]
MAHAQPTPTRTSRPLRGFSITLRTPGYTLAFSAISRCSSEAAELALSHCPEDAPFGLVVKPMSRSHGCAK